MDSGAGAGRWPALVHGLWEYAGFRAMRTGIFEVTDAYEKAGVQKLSQGERAGWREGLVALDSAASLCFKAGRPDSDKSKLI